MNDELMKEELRDKLATTEKELTKTEEAMMVYFGLSITLIGGILCYMLGRKDGIRLGH